MHPIDLLARSRPAGAAALLVLVAHAPGGCARPQAAGPAPLELEHAIALPGVGGRIDHLDYDAADHRLFVAALGNDTLEVVDPVEPHRVGSLDGVPRPTGVVVAAGRVWVAVSEDEELRAIDPKTLAVTAHVGGLPDGDNIRWDPASRRIYVGYGSELGIVDPETASVVARVELPAHPESLQVESGGPRVFVNVPGAGEIAVVDREQARVVAEWPLGRLHANFPMALDEEGGRVLVGCRRPARLAVVDMESGEPVADFEMSDDVDDFFLDAKRGLLYASCGEGTVDVYRRLDADHYERIARVPTRPGARTCLWSPELDRLLVAAPHRGSEDAAILVLRPR